MNIVTQQPPTLGYVRGIQDNEVIVRRFMVRRADTDGYVYQLFKETITADAEFYLDGKKSSRSQALQEKHLVRILPPQQQMIRGFSSQATVRDAKESFGEKHAWTRGGYVPDGVVVPHEGTKKQGNPIIKNFVVTEGGEPLGAPIEINTKCYTILDGRMMRRKNLVAQPGNKLIKFTFKGGKGAKYILGRSTVAGIEEGVIEAIDGDKISVKLIDNTIRVVDLEPGCQFFLDADASTKAKVIHKGMPVMIYHSRPQLVDAWAYPPIFREHTGYAQRNHAHFRVDEYQLDGTVKILREGIGARDR